MNEDTGRGITRDIRRVYLAVPSRHVLSPTDIAVVERLFDGAEVYAPRYGVYEWQRVGPERIRRSMWYCAWIPEDGIVGRGPFEEIALALRYHREVTIVVHGVPHNVTSQPFEIHNRENWREYARLKSDIPSSLETAIGVDLDRIGDRDEVSRYQGEADRDYRDRIRAGIKGNQPWPGDNLTP